MTTSRRLANQEGRIACGDTLGTVQIPVREGYRHVQGMPGWSGISPGWLAGLFTDSRS